MTEEHKISLNCPRCEADGDISILCCIYEGEGVLVEYKQGDIAYNKEEVYTCNQCGKKYRLQDEQDYLLGTA